jgi:hypothetical protein
LKFDLNPYGFMGKLQAENCSNLEEHAIAQKIVEWLLRTPKLRDVTVDCLVRAFVKSGSFDNSRHLLLELENVETFTAEQLNGLDEATKANSQVREALIGKIPVPNRIRQLISKHGGTSGRSSPAWTSEPPF